MRLQEFVSLVAIHFFAVSHQIAMPFNVSWENWEYLHALLNRWLFVYHHHHHHTDLISKVSNNSHLISGIPRNALLCSLTFLLCSLSLARSSKISERNKWHYILLSRAFVNSLNLPPNIKRIINTVPQRLRLQNALAVIKLRTASFRSAAQKSRDHR